MEEEYNTEISLEDVEKILGVSHLERGKYENNDVAGVVTGLAWTSVGGDILFIESIVSKGKGLTITGNLGKVMKESATIAMEYIRANAAVFGIKDKSLSDNKVHIHVPEGATPKDGPSAGVGMCTALVSALTKIPVHATVAMTGEITLRGTVLPIGGLKEKLLAAHRGGIETVIIPSENEKDLTDIPKNILRKLDIHPVTTIDEVLEIALVEFPKPLPGAVGPKNSLTDVSETEIRPH